MTHLVFYAGLEQSKEAPLKVTMLRRLQEPLSQKSTIQAAGEPIQMLILQPR